MNSTASFSLHEAPIAARIAQFEREAAEIRDARTRFIATRTHTTSDRAPATPVRSHAPAGRIARARVVLSQRWLAPHPSRS